MRLEGAGHWSPDGHWARLDRAVAHLDGPVAALSLEALAHNAAALVRLADGVPLRLATKSIRSRDVVHAVLSTPGWRGVLAATLPEALWLAETVDDVLVGYPSADRAALRAIAADDAARARVTLMVDDVAHLDLVDAAAPGHPELRVAIELDAALVRGPIRYGVRRSPVRSVATAVALAEAIARRPGFRLVGLMAYESQVAGVPDGVRRGSAPALAVRTMQRLSMRDVLERRAAAVAAVGRVAELELVNGGGTGSIDRTARDPSVTEVAAGSGLYGPHLFDGYRAVAPAPALAFSAPVVRRPSPGCATLLGGGWTASGPARRDRLPVVVWPEGLRLDAEEGAGEVQTPVLGAAADGLRVGDRVWLRHAKAGEPCERIDRLHVVAGDAVVGTAITYRGEGRMLL